MIRFYITIVSMVLMNISFVSNVFATQPSDASVGFINVYRSIFGIEKSRVAPSSTVDCLTVDQNGGAIGGINGFFCHMKYDMSLTTVGSATKTYGSLKVHAEIAASCTGLDSKSYDFSANVWTCNTKKLDCTQAANYVRTASACFSAASDLTINKGTMIMDNGIFNGSGSGVDASQIIYDLGTASTSQSISMKILGLDPSGNGFAAKIDGTRTDKNHLTATALLVSGGTTPSASNSARFAFTIDRSLNVDYAYMEGFGTSVSSTCGSGGNLDCGIGTWSATAHDDKPSDGACFTRTSDGAGDWAYAETSGGSSCAPNIAFPNKSLTDVSAFTYSTISGTWNGMAANPTSI